MAYVYRHIRLDKNEPFYIGIGSDSDGKYTRAKSKENRNNHWNNIIDCTQYKIEILFDDLTWEEANEKEIELVALYGRRDLGLGNLVNLTNGGEGMVGYKHSEETRKKMSNSQIGKKLSEFTRKKMSDSRSGEKHIMFGKKLNESHIEKLKENHWTKKEGFMHPMYGKKHNEDTKQKMSEKAKGRKSPMSKQVIDLSNGFIYDSAKEAFLSQNQIKKHSTLIAMLRGQNKNKTNFKYI
jgi:hypothetical protein